MAQIFQLDTGCIYRLRIIERDEYFKGYNHNQQKNRNLKYA